MSATANAGLVEPLGHTLMVRRPPTDADSQSNSELLIAADGDQQAFAVFYRRHIDGVLAHVWTHTKDHEVTADLTAEVFAVALEHLDRFDPNLGNPRQWLHGITRNVLGKHWRTRSVEDRAMQRIGMRNVRLQNESELELAAIARLDAAAADPEQALNRLSDQTRQAVRLRVLEDLSYQQIGQRLGCKTATARMRVMRGMKRFRTEFDRTQKEGPGG